MPTPETSLETSSNMSLEDIGLVLATSTVWGSAFQFFKGIYNSPKGQRLIRGTQAVRRNGLRSGGINVAWFCLLHVMECSIDHVRQKEDPWNHIFSSAAAAGLLQMRKGLGPASRWSLFGGVFGALFRLGNGVFHVAHPVDLKDKETEETKINKSVSGALGILQACLVSKTVKRVAGVATVMFHKKDLV
ncbi:Uncharacterized protein Fot_17981 [Forsythia ovata]|uniref:Uncharacterized protein n=1 Tax=Forsythia ovata TaxID=205694 RepID=A0ABD1VGX0_9LAMI